MEFLVRLAGLFGLSTLTAVVTLALAVLLSAAVGTSRSAEVVESRCEAAILQQTLFEVASAQGIELDVPVISIAGLDCSVIIEVP